MNHVTVINRSFATSFGFQCLLFRFYAKPAKAITFLTLETNVRPGGEGGSKLSFTSSLKIFVQQFIK
jgi:hypothetical protein